MLFKFDMGDLHKLHFIAPDLYQSLMKIQRPQLVILY
jgi:hypothetical protein